MKADAVILSYKGALGLDMIVGGALSFFTSQLPELAAGMINYALKEESGV